MEEPIKKVAIIGPECTGKSDLTSYLATYFNTVWVPEYARLYIDNLQRPYHQDDLLTIAKGQINSEDELTGHANRVIFCDTNLYVIKVWSEFKFGNTHPEILATMSKRKYDLYLLTNVDIPWEADPQREHPHQREQLYEIYKNEMLQQAVPFVEIRGEREQRRNQAVAAIRKWILH